MRPLKGFVCVFVFVGWVYYKDKGSVEEQRGVVNTQQRERERERWGRE